MSSLNLLISHDLLGILNNMKNMKDKNDIENPKLDSKNIDSLLL